MDIKMENEGQSRENRSVPFFSRSSISVDSTLLKVKLNDKDISYNPKSKKPLVYI